jgi:hypothetical protein
VVGTGVALLALVDEAAAAVAPTEMAAGTTIGAKAAPVVATVAAPAAWPPAAAPVAAGAWATVVDAAAGAAGTAVCATATPAAAMADNRKTSLMTESPRKVNC